MALFGKGSPMKIPKNMTEQETVDKITLVVNRIAPKYTFNGYDVEDIKQEAFIICIDALDRYDNKRPLENFLSVNLSNRLKNFIRDNFGNAKDTEKKKINSPVNINSNSCIEAQQFYTADMDLIDNKELIQQIEDNMPIHLREDYLKFVHGVNIPKNRKDLLFAFIKELLDAQG